MEEEKEKKDVKVQQATATDPGVGKKLDTILKQLDTMQTRLDDLEKKQSKSHQFHKPKKPFPGKCFKCGAEGHRQFECPLNSKQPASGASGQAVVAKPRSR